RRASGIYIDCGDDNCRNEHSAIDVGIAVASQSRDRQCAESRRTWEDEASHQIGTEMTSSPLWSLRMTLSVNVPNPLVHPVIDRLVPELAILRLEYPVALVREIEHFRWNFQP